MWLHLQARHGGNSPISRHAPRYWSPRLEGRSDEETSVIETAQGRVTLTQLGREVLPGSGEEHAARVTAFLNVELFRAMYDQHKGNVLPPTPAIERQMAQLGVSPKQTERAPRHSRSRRTTWALSMRQAAGSS